MKRTAKSTRVIQPGNIVTTANYKQLLGHPILLESQNTGYLKLFYPDGKVDSYTGVFWYASDTWGEPTQAEAIAGFLAAVGSHTPQMLVEVVGEDSTYASAEDTRIAAHAADFMASNRGLFEDLAAQERAESPAVEPVKQVELSAYQRFLNWLRLGA